MTKPGGQKPSSASPGLHIGDLVGVVLLAISLMILSYLRSRHTIFWSDEIMGFLTLRQPTFSSVLHVWREGLDSSGIWFYVLGRPWTDVFGASELSLRMFSGTGIAASAAVLWIAARRYYGFFPVAAAITSMYAFLQPLRWQLANGRTYGLFMLASALTIYMILRGEDADAARPKALFLLGTFATYSFLAGSHILGSLYVGAFLATQVLLDIVNRRFRPLLYLSAACSFMVVWFSRANIQSTAALGKPSFWTLKPRLMELASMTTVFGGKRIVLVIALLFAVSFLHLRFTRERRAIYVILVGFLGLDLLVFVYSRFTTSIYVDRYLLPFAMAAVLLLCELLTQLESADAPRAAMRSAAAPVLLLIGVVGLALPRLLPVWYPLPDYTAHLLAAVPSDLPVVDTDVASFVEVHFYRHNALKSPLVFPTDWESALDKSNTGGVSGFHEMDNFKRLGVDSADILPSQEVLQRYSTFTVLTTPSNAWFRRRILGDPRFHAIHTGSFAEGFVALEIWRVQGPS